MTGIVYLFPGQGAQAIGMGKGFYDTYPESRDVYTRARQTIGVDLAALCFEGSPEELTKTAPCQLALFVTSLAALAAWRTVAPSVKPLGMAGLSLGELTALVAADVLSFRDGLTLVQARGEAMAECAAHSHGAMLAVIGLAPDVIESICETSGATAANYNAPEQVVLSGTVEAIRQAEELAKTRGAKRAIPLEVAGAFHSSLMQPASNQLKTALSKIDLRPARVPVISNVTGKPVQDPPDIRDLLVKQIVNPVLWEPSMRYLIHAGASHFIEFPPARILTGLLRRIDRGVRGVAVDEPKDFEKLGDLFTIRSTP